jgi:hypothetical protein
VNSREPPAQLVLALTGQLGQGNRSSGQSHHESLTGSAYDGTVTDDPVNVVSLQAETPGSRRASGANPMVAEYLTDRDETVGRYLAQPTKWSPNVLLVHERIQQTDPTPEQLHCVSRCGTTTKRLDDGLGASVPPRRHRSTIRAVDREASGEEGRGVHHRVDAVVADRMSGHISDRPALAERRDGKLLGRERLK